VEEPVPAEIVALGSLDMRELRASIVDEDGDLVLRMHDGDVSVDFEPGAGGSIEQAILGAERLGSTALAYAELLRRLAQQGQYQRRERHQHRQAR
jgi:hypothetical protein